MSHITGAAALENKDYGLLFEMVMLQQCFTLHRKILSFPLTLQSACI